MTSRNVSALALVVDDTPDGVGPLENPIGRLVVQIEADIRGHDLRSLKARHQSGRLIDQHAAPLHGYRWAYAKHL